MRENTGVGLNIKGKDGEYRSRIEYTGLVEGYIGRIKIQEQDGDT